MRYPVFVAATVTLSVSLASVLTAWLIVAAKTSKSPQRLVAGQTSYSPSGVEIVFLGHPHQASSLALPASTRFMRVRSRQDAMRLKWLWSPAASAVLFVQPGVAPDVLHSFLTLCSSGVTPVHDIVYAPTRTNLFAQVDQTKQRRVKKWGAFMRENVHPAWWLSLLYPDLHILLRRATMRTAPRSKCETMMKFMGDFKLWNDQLMFGYFFSPLVVQPGFKMD